MSDVRAYESPSAYDEGKRPQVTDRTSSIHIGVNQMKESLQRLEKVIEALTERVSPVLNPDTPHGMPERDGVIERNPGSTIAQDLFQLRLVVEKMVERLSTLEQRVDL